MTANDQAPDGQLAGDGDVGDGVPFVPFEEPDPALVQPPVALVNFACTSSPATTSIAAAATDLACTSSPTLVRSENTGASHKCRIGRAGGPCSVTHESR
jgi:hypothetical protein